MPVADSDGVAIEYQVRGPETGETVVFVSGLGYGQWLWDWQVPAFEDDYRVITYDLRGVGGSDTPEGPYSIEEMAGDLESVLVDAGAERAHVIGISMGGMIAQQYAVDYDRTESLVLMSTDCGGPDSIGPAPAVAERILNPPEDVPMRENIEYKMQPAFTDEFWGSNRDVIEEILDYRTAAPVPDEVRGWQAAGVAAFDLSERLEEIAAPTLVLHGERDRVVPVENADRLGAGIEDATVETFDAGGSHLFPIERATDVNPRLRTFLE